MDVCVIVDRLLPSLQTPEDVMHGPLAIDFSSCDLIPTEHYAEFVALKTFGDGKCCFRAASLMLFWTEQNHLEIRVCTILEQSGTVIKFDNRDQNKLLANQTTS